LLVLFPEFFHRIFEDIEPSRLRFVLRQGRYAYGDIVTFEFERRKRLYHPSRRGT